MTCHWSGFELPGRALPYHEALGYASACLPHGTPDELDFLALQIAVMTALDDAFEAMDARVQPDPRAWLLPWLGAEGDVAADATWQPHWQVLRAALEALHRTLATLARGNASRRASVHGWWRRQAERQVVAFYREAQWRAERTAPDLNTYLAVGQRSIGVEWTAATLIAFDTWAAAPRLGSALTLTIDAIARAVRLANDLHDPERERLEGKPQWLLMRAAQLALAGLDVHSAEHEARKELSHAVRVEVAAAQAELRGQSIASAQLRRCLAGLLGIGLAVYAPDLAAPA